jgi:hypothetical protein
MTYLSTLGIFFGGHSTASPAYAVVLIAAAIGVRFFLYRGRSRGPYGGGPFGRGSYRRGPWGGGPGGNGPGGQPDAPPMQMDIRKSPDTTESAAPTPPPAPPMRPPAPTDEQNPPSDL